MALNLHSIRALIIDVDGVLWRGKQPLPGVAAFFDFLQSRRLPFIIATNNSMHPASDITARLARIGAHVSEEHVLTSAEAAALYLPRIAPNAKRVYLLGGEGLVEAMTRAGYDIVDQDADAVIAGIDVNLTYEKLKRAAREIRRGALFIGTNADKTLPVDNGDVVPGAGPIIAAIQTATDVVPIIIGKPARAMFDIAVEKMNLPREFTAMLGDRLDTDIEGGRGAGLKSILVLTGVTTSEMLAQSSIQPDFVFQDLNALRTEWARLLTRALV
jgi:4-nitrophenyl phosphatase